MRLKTRIDLAFIAGLVVVLVVGALSWLGADRLATIVNHVERSREVDVALDRVRDDLRELETGARGFVITGDPSFLDPYVHGTAALPADLLALRMAIPRSSLFATTLEDELEPVVARQLAHATAVIQRRRARGFEPDYAATAEVLGRELMDAAQQLITELERTEDARIAQLVQSARSRTSLALALVVASALGMGLLVLVGVVMIRRSLVAPIAALGDAARRARRGDWPGPVSTRNDELGELERALADMVAARVEAEHHARELVDDAPEPFLLTDPHGQLIDVNRATCELLGFARAELLERRLDDLIAPEDAALLVAAVNVLSPGGPIHVAEWRLRTRSDEAIPIEIRAKRFADGRLQAFARDLRDRKRADQERVAGLRAREELVAVVSHDLKNPLNAIELRARLIDRHARDDKVREHCAAVHGSVATMQRMIRGLLDAASLEAGRLRLELDDHDLGELVAEVVEVLAPVAADAEVTLTARVASGQRWRFDRDRIAQVLFNLVGNALKFTPAGGDVTISVELRDAAAVVAVSDTGTGIAAEAIPHVFERFFTSGGRVGGTGLGLSIAKGLVEAHGGTIRADSVSGEGTVFEFTLPPAARG